MLCNGSPMCLLQHFYAPEKPTTNPRLENGEKTLCTRGPTMLCTTMEKNVEKCYAPKDQHCYAPEKNPSLSRKHDGENPRTNTATHQKKCPRFPENTMEKTQGPTLL